MYDKVHHSFLVQDVHRGFMIVLIRLSKVGHIQTTIFFYGDSKTSQSVHNLHNLLKGETCPYNQFIYADLKKMKMSKINTLRRQ